MFLVIKSLKALIEVSIISNWNNHLILILLNCKINDYFFSFNNDFDLSGNYMINKVL